ncbi:hypothetical protein Hypma_015883 [Hypsizygus marmoreus]|uniref:Uncharacterized protein n=1 Tax=Hypsizygus marmoreus TaxID=39966 RepID=A0A369K548_HYPMA|nr:hypothetical protein Hypma_015883 [Hypsizygus marmoreus]
MSFQSLQDHHSPYVRPQLPLHRIAVINGSVHRGMPVVQLVKIDTTELNKLVESKRSTYTGLHGRVYMINEVMLMVMESSSWKSIVALSHVDQVGRMRAQYYYRARLAGVLTHILPCEAFRPFFALLSSSKAAIYGSVPWAVFSTSIRLRGSAIPTDLNIVIPRGQFPAWYKLLNASGFKDYSIIYPWPSYLDNVAAICHRFWKPLNLTVTVIESLTQAILPVIVSSPITTHMNIITASHFFCFYPDMLASRQAFRGFADSGNFASHNLFSRSTSFSTTTRYMSDGFVSLDVIEGDTRSGIYYVGALAKSSQEGGDNVSQSSTIKPSDSQSSSRKCVAELTTKGSRKHRIWDAYSEFATSLVKWRTGVFCLNVDCPYNNISRKTLAAMKKLKT